MKHTYKYVIFVKYHHISIKYKICTILVKRNGWQGDKSVGFNPIGSEFKSLNCEKYLHTLLLYDII